MKYYSEGEVREIVEELSEAAEEAIEQAAAEAAKAEALASLERETAVRVEAVRWERSYREERGRRVVSGVICFLGGFAVGVGGVLLMRK